MRSQRGIKFLTAALLSTLLAACGGGGGSLGGTGSSTGTTGTPTGSTAGGTTTTPLTAAVVRLLDPSSEQVPSNTSPSNSANGIVLTALVLDTGGLVVPGATVTFTAVNGMGNPVGALQTDGSSTSNVTGTTGEATMRFTAAGSPAGQVFINASITVGGAPINAINGPQSVRIVPASGGVDIFSANGNAILLSTASDPDNGLSITAVVRNTSGAVQAGVPVTFTSSSGVITGVGADPDGTVSTNTSGIVTAVLTTGSNATPRTISVTASTPTVSSAPFQVLVVRPISNVELVVSSPAQLLSTASTVSQGLPVTATVRDSTGTLLPGVTVSFTAVCPTPVAVGCVAGGIIVTQAITDASGIARAVVTNGGNTTLRTLQVRANANQTGSGMGTNSNTVSVPVVADTSPAASPASVTLSLSAATLPNNANGTTVPGVTVTALVRDANGNAVADVPVTLAVRPVEMAEFNGALQILRGTTDSTGTAIAILTNGGNTSTRELSLSASVVSGGTTINAVAQPIDVVAAANGIELFTSATRLLSNATATVNGVTVTAVVRDAEGAVLEDVPVTFTASSGLLNPATADLTDMNGLASTVLTTGGNPTLRTITLTASAPGATATPVTVQVVNPVNTINLVAASPGQLLNTLGAGSAPLAISATVLDSLGNVLAGVPVTFLVSPAVMGNVNGDFTVDNVITNANGVASTTLTNNNSATLRDLTVSATAGGVSSGSQTIQVVSSVPPVAQQAASVSIGFSASGLLSNADGVAAPGVTVTARVLDSNGFALAGVPVQFSVSASPVPNGRLSGGGITATANTDAAGNATTVLTNGGSAIQRTFTLQAVVNTGSGMISATDTIAIVSAANGVELFSTAPNASTRLRSDGSNTIPLRAIVRDSNGLPLAGSTVNFAATSGAVTPVCVDAMNVIVACGMTDPRISGADGSVNAVLTTAGNSARRTITVTASAINPNGAPANSAPLAVQVENPVVIRVVAASAPQLLRTASSPTTSNVTLTAFIGDANGIALEGVPVTFNVLCVSPADPMMCPNGAIFNNGIVTNEDGNATAILTNGGSTALRTLSVTVTADGSSSAALLIPVVTSPAAVSQAVEAVRLSANTTQLLSDGSNTVTLRAVVTNEDGITLAGVPVDFRLISGSVGAITVTRATTDASGVAIADLSTGGNPAARTISVQAFAIADGGAEVASDNDPEEEENQPLDIKVVNRVNSITLVASTPTLLTGSTQGVTFTALVKDASNNLLAGIPVSFSSAAAEDTTCGAGGAIRANSAVTDASGTVTAVLTTGGDPQNQLITVTATAAGEDTSLNIPVTGTQVTISGPASVGQGVREKYTVSFIDSLGQGIPNQVLTIDSVLDNDLSLQSDPLHAQVTSFTTDSSGQVKLNYLGENGGNDTLTVSVEENTCTPSPALAIQVSAQSLEFTAGPTSNGDTITAADFMIAGVDSTQIVALADNTNAAFFKVGNTVRVSDGADTISGIITSISGVNLTLRTSAILAGMAGNTMAAGATITAGTAVSTAAFVIPALGNTVNVTLGNAAQTALFSDDDVVRISDGVRRITGVVQDVPAGPPDVIVLRVTAVESGASGDSMTLGALVTKPNNQVLIGGGAAMIANGQRVTVRLSGAPIAAQSVTLSTTRGVFSATGTNTVTVTTDANGIAFASLRQNTATSGTGGGVVTAIGPNGITDTQPFAVVSNAPDKISLEAQPSNISINGGVSTLRAIVRDANDNPVKDSTVNFTLVDNSGGSLSSSTGVTDSQGVVAITYTSSGTASARDGVQVTASANRINADVISDVVNLTVGGQALRIVLGTGNTIVAAPAPNTNTLYQLPYSVLVSDSAGNPPPANTSVSLLIEPVAYQKGVLTCPPPDGPWAPVYAVTNTALQTSSLTPPVVPFGCVNEDSDRDGILDVAQMEDFNSNSALDPGNVALVPSSVALDANGLANFNVTYPKDRTNWVQVRLTATVSVSGTESRETQTFVLPGVSDDFNDCNISPPGVVSPYGVATNCAVGDNAPTVGFSSLVSTFTAAGAGTSVALTASLTRAHTAEVRVPFTVLARNANSVAVPIVDSVVVSNGTNAGAAGTSTGILVIPIGALSGTITVNINGTSVATNTVTVSMTNPPVNASLTSTATPVVTMGVLTLGHTKVLTGN